MNRFASCNLYRCVTRKERVQDKSIYVFFVIYVTCIFVSMSTGNCYGTMPSGKAVD
jgi:hypothetical protein